MTAETRALRQACRHAGLDYAGAALIRRHANATYLLPAVNVVARVGSSWDASSRAAAGVAVTRWLHTQGFPTVEPLEVDQPTNYRHFLQDRREKLLDQFTRLDFILPSGLIHGDADVSNLLHDGHLVRLADWDSVCLGPREQDLTLTHQDARFGLPPAGSSPIRAVVAFHAAERSSD